MGREKQYSLSANHNTQKWIVKCPLLLKWSSVFYSVSTATNSRTPFLHRLIYIMVKSIQSFSS